ncbi:MAG TPA: murein biosynthesis integral membrane protein MurJ [Candidatus Saccharimonadales bacterium]|nr:murein biosynthesis integral membrane protein MurJ [Candidatus Saccharimonadales bacterium]
MKQLISKFNRRNSFSGAATLIGFFYLASRFLGLVRDRLLASHFGIGAMPDAYAAAFRIPDLIFTLMVSGAFAVAFIPIFTEFWVKKEREQAWHLTNSLLNILAVATIVICALIFIFVGPISSAIAPGFDPYRHQVLVNLTRIMLWTPVFFAISSVMGSVQQSFNRFLFFAISGIFYNLGIIFGIIFLSERFSIYGVAIGVVIGAASQALIQILGMFGLGYRYHWRFRLRDLGVVRVIRLMIPRALDQGIDQINYTVQTIIGSQLATGSLTAFYYANNLRNVPLVIFGTSIATAAFPDLAARAARNDIKGLVDKLDENTRLILFFVVPAAAVAILLRGYIVRLLFGFGNQTTANTLGWFAATIIFQSLFFLVARFYYALQDTKTPLYLSIFTIGLNIVLSLILSPHYGVVGLAMAQSIVSALETTVLYLLLMRKLPTIGLGRIMNGALKIGVASLIMGSLIYLSLNYLLPLNVGDRGLFVVAPKFLALLAIGTVGYLLPCYLMRLEEAHAFTSRFFNYLRPTNQIVN